MEGRLGGKAGAPAPGAPLAPAVAGARAQLREPAAKRPPPAGRRQPVYWRSVVKKLGVEKSGALDGATGITRGRCIKSASMSARCVATAPDGRAALSRQKAKRRG